MVATSVTKPPMKPTIARPATSVGSWYHEQRREDEQRGSADQADPGEELVRLQLGQRRRLRRTKRSAGRIVVVLGARPRERASGTRRRPSVVAAGRARAQRRRRSSASSGRQVALVDEFLVRRRFSLRPRRSSARRAGRSRRRSAAQARSSLASTSRVVRREDRAHGVGRDRVDVQPVLTPARYSGRSKPAAVVDSTGLVYAATPRVLRSSSSASASWGRGRRRRVGGRGQAVGAHRVTRTACTCVRDELRRLREDALGVVVERRDVVAVVEDALGHVGRRDPCMISCAVDAARRRGRRPTGTAAAAR